MATGFKITWSQGGYMVGTGATRWTISISNGESSMDLYFNPKLVAPAGSEASTEVFCVQ